MASFFKFSCTVYWVGWFYYIGYIMGTQLFVKKYILKTPEVGLAEAFIVTVCLFNITMSLFGCAFVKCDVVNIFCALGFVASLITVNSVLTSYGMNATRAATENFPDVVTYLKSYRKNVPVSRVELNAECCGYWGYWDHASILGNPQTGNIPSGNMSSHIPWACCHQKDEACHHYIDIPLGNRSGVTGLTVAELAVQSGCPFPEEDVEKVMPLYKAHRTLYFVNKSVDDAIVKCGCYQKLFSAHMGLYDYSHVIFYIMNGIFIFLYLVIYIRNWFIMKFDDGSSDHTLDEDSLSELKTPPPTQSATELFYGQAPRDSLPPVPAPPPPEPTTHDTPPIPEE